MANLLHDWNANSGTVLTISFVVICVLALGANQFIDAQQSEATESTTSSVREEYAGSSAAVPATPKFSRVTVTVTGFESDIGSARVAVYGSPEDLRARSNPIVSSEQGILNGKVVWLIDLPIETDVAIAAYHDKDSNDKLSRGALGIPSEAYGFSNNARGMAGPPSYRDAVVRFSESIEQIEFSVK